MLILFIHGRQKIERDAHSAGNMEKEESWHIHIEAKRSKMFSWRQAMAIKFLKK